MRSPRQRKTAGAPEPSSKARARQIDIKPARSEEATRSSNLSTFFATLERLSVRGPLPKNEFRHRKIARVSDFEIKILVWDESDFAAKIFDGRHFVSN